MISLQHDFPKINPPDKLDDQSSEGVNNLKYKNILQSSFVYLMVGRPGCGKSHLITELITRQDFYKKQFHKVIIISPSRISHKLNVEQDQFYSESLTQSHISFVIDSLNQRTCNTAGRMFNFLFIIDDCVSQLRHVGQSSIINNLFFNRRHIVQNANISIIVTTQEFKSISPQIRSVVTGIFLFHPSPKDILSLKMQYVGDNDCIQQLFIEKMMNALGSVGAAVLPSLISYAKQAAVDYFTKTLGAVSQQMPRTLTAVSDVVYDTMGNLRDLSKDPQRYEKICGGKKKARRSRSYDDDWEDQPQPGPKLRNKKKKRDYEADWQQ